MVSLGLTNPSVAGDSQTAKGQPLPSSDFNQPLLCTQPAQPDRSESSNGATVCSHAREPSGPRGRTAMNGSNLHAQQGGSRSQSSAATTRSPALVNGNMERRPSLTQNYHRQAAKTHGPLQHSRNASFVNSPPSSPLSPYIPGVNAPANGSMPEFSSLTMHQHGAPELRPSGSPSSTNSSLISATPTMTGGQESPESSNLNLIQRKVDRIGGNRVRRTHSHHRSHSKHPGSGEVKTAYEHALHHLFNSVCGSFMFARLLLMDATVHLTSGLQDQSMRCWYF